jgi:hypothetical protein
MSLAAVGVADHLGWGWFVTVTVEEGQPRLLSSRRFDLAAPDLPKMPFHHEPPGLSLEAAEALIGRLKASAFEHAMAALEAINQELGSSHRLTVLSIRHPSLPSIPSVEEVRGSSYLDARADGTLYNKAICAAAERMGLRAVFHKRGDEEKLAAEALGVGPERLKADIARMGDTASNWTKEHRAAAAAALAALSGAGTP